MPLHPLFQGWVGFLSRQAKPSRIFNLFGQGSLPGQIERLPGQKGRSETGRIALPTHVAFWVPTRSPRPPRRNAPLKDTRRPLVTISRPLIATAEVMVLWVSPPSHARA